MSLLTPQQIAKIKSSAKEPRPPSIHRLQQHQPHPQADIRPPWLWHRYIPRAGTTLLAAPPGAGKSSLTLDLAARVSQGLPMPDGTTAPETPGSVLIIAPEDPQDLVAQRLQLLHADPERIHFYYNSPGMEIDSLEELLDEIPNDIALIIIDPVTSFLPRLAPGNLFHFAHVSEAYNVPILLTVPLRRPVYSAADLPYSLGALASYPRSILSLITPSRTAGILPASPAAPSIENQKSKIENPPTPADRLLLPIKSNAAALPPPIPFTLGPTLTWHPPQPNAPLPLDPALQEAVDFLQQFLAPGPQPATEVFQAASQNLISRITLYRAKKILQIQSNRHAIPGPWHWSLKSHPGNANLLIGSSPAVDINSLSQTQSPPQNA